MAFQIVSDFKPTGDQPEAIKQLVEGLNNGSKAQTLLGVTGSGKTFTIANVIEQIQRPTLILSHNKTLAAQLYGEFKQFFPNNAVEYFVSYYDYYQPEAYLPVTDTYIEKDMSINDEIEKLRLSTTTSLLSGRQDVVVIASVSCIYGIGNPADFQENIIKIKVGDSIPRNKFLLQLVQSLYSRSETDFQRGNFRVKGDTVDVYPAYAEIAYRIYFFGDEIEDIESFDPINGTKIEEFNYLNIYPANIFNTTKETLHSAIHEIQIDLGKQVEYYKEIGKHLEAKRLEDRVTYDMEMMRELGYCSGIENYSRYFDRRPPGSRPFCLLDYFPKDFLMVIDESHVTVSQIGAMYGGDRSRKQNLVEYGFRLPSAMDNRPLKFDEFYSLINQVIYVSATPADFELKESEGIVVEQVVRPTGLLEPEIEVRPSLNQIDDLMEEITIRAEKDERVLVTTLTKRMAEELDKYFDNNGIRCRYIHSEVDTIERVEILRDLRLGLFDVLIGVNLLREGLDLPEVSLVAILDADKEGFLRSERSLIQTAGRAARNIEGRVIMYADKITKSMQKTIDETNRKREKQIKYNVEHNITPKALNKSKNEILGQTTVIDDAYLIENYDPKPSLAADPVVKYMNKEQLQKLLEETQSRMKKVAKQEDFIEAARLRDEMMEISKMIKKEA
ncbi:MAG: excinuclease ABC subunit UvrB [Flavobacteriales bacterium]|nr:excinuclease ABC subunit UvrB [Flavobacteriales bacterium]